MTRRPRLFTAHCLLLTAYLFLLSACGPIVPQTPPRLATQTAQAQLDEQPQPTLTPMTLGAELNLPNAGIPPTRASTTHATITLWVNETSEEHAVALEQMAAAFALLAQTHVEIVRVEPDLLPDLVATAAISDTLPDLILHPIDYSHGWVDAGILDAAAATTVLDQLHRDTFHPDILPLMAAADNSDEIVGLPSDAWKQLLIYRTDWFAENNLAAPDNFEAMLTAAAAISATNAAITGIVVPTESSLPTTQYVFEQWAAATGCQLINDKGEVTLVHPACLEALQFYRTFINQYSPSDVQTDTSALNAFLEGRTGMIVASPGVMPALAGLDPNNLPRCPACTTPDFLAQNSGFISEIKGRGAFAASADFSQISVLGITTAAKPQAQQFAQFWFEDGYLTWLEVEPERKVPLRQVNANVPAIFELFAEDTLQILTDNIIPAKRWGLSQAQGTLITQLAKQKTFPLLLQELLSGYLTTSQAVVEGQKRVIDLIPNYQYDVPATDE